MLQIKYCHKIIVNTGRKYPNINNAITTIILIKDMKIFIIKTRRTIIIIKCVSLGHITKMTTIIIVSMK